MCESGYNVVNKDSSFNLNSHASHKILSSDQNSIYVGSGIRAVGLGKSPKINKRRAYAYFRL